jgi:hypothetical protein
MEQPEIYSGEEWNTWVRAHIRSALEMNDAALHEAIAVVLTDVRHEFRNEFKEQIAAQRHELRIELQEQIEALRRELGPQRKPRRTAK